MTFEQWMKAVDAYVWGFAGLSVYDLADANFRVWYDDGMGVEEAALEALRYSGYPC